MPEIHPVAYHLSYEQRLRAARPQYIVSGNGALRSEVDRCCPLGHALKENARWLSPFEIEIWRKLLDQDDYDVPEHDDEVYRAICDWVKKNDSGGIAPEDVAPMLGIDPETGRDLLVA